MFEAIVVAQQSGSGGIIGLLISVCMFAVFGLAPLAGLWKMFEKAGKPGWAAIVPIYNLWVLVEISTKDTLWFVLALIPVINIVAAIILTIDIAQQFGKGVGYGIFMLLIPFIAYPMLGFGDAQYVG